MLSELAPIDLLLQRTGRVHRHRFRQRPTGMERPIMHIILPDEDAVKTPEKRYGSSGYVYEPFLLNNTERLIDSGLSIHVPEDVRSVIRKVYETVTDENFDAWCKKSFGQQFQQANGSSVSFPIPEAETFFASEAQSEFVDLEVDDGFEPSFRASTRLGEPTLRISFANESLYEAAQNGHLTKSQKREIFMSSAAISMRGISQTDLETSLLFKVEKGVLRGCYISAQDDIITIGRRELLNDPVLGIMWKE